jgi:hypothetical protein
MLIDIRNPYHDDFFCSSPIIIIKNNYSVIFIIIILKMKIDKKGRSTSKSDDNDGYKFTITFPSI